MKTRGKADPSKSRKRQHRGARRRGSEVRRQATLEEIDVDRVIEEVMVTGRTRFRNLAKLFSLTRRALGVHGEPFMKFVAQHSRMKKHLTVHMPGSDVATLTRTHGKQDLTAPAAHTQDFMRNILEAFSSTLGDPSAASARG